MTYRNLIRATGISLAFAVGLVAPLRAEDVSVSAIFSDHMVLQHDVPLPVWGWADAGTKVSVEINGQNKTTTADPSGNWKVQLDPLPVTTKPLQLKVQGNKQKDALTINDILVGEVWLGSGQSNMAMTVNGVQDAEAEKRAADLPLIRMFKEESTSETTPQSRAKGTWKVCSPQNVIGFSASLYFFGRELHRDLNVPIGLINSSVGGTPIESWISAEAQAATPELASAYEANKREAEKFDAVKASEEHKKNLAAWKERAARAKEAGKTPPAAPRDPVVQFRRRGGPGGLFNGKINPLIPYAIRGVVWYQGENNANSDKSDLYQYQLAALVKDWRTRWHSELPFAWVQLPNYNGRDPGWSIVREGMLKALSVPKTGMAITIDVGEPGNIHPKNKQEVGRRLALWALGDVYQRSVPATSGPLPSEQTMKADTFVVKFKHANQGLKTSDGKALRGFSLAGEDKVWKPAEAKIEGDSVIVTCKEITKPIALRYAWSSNPDCNLCNAAGLPASPFRTDTEE